MRKCPLCDKEASSPHHIKPRSEGGTDDERNLVWLCKSCHDRVEGLEFTPDLIESERRRMKGARATSGETYEFMVHDDCVIFAGIAVDDKVIVPLNIRLPREQQFADAQVVMPLDGNGDKKLKKAVPKLKTMPPTGRPHRTISAYMAKILDEDISLAEKAKYLGLPKTTIHRYIKERREQYIAS